MVSSTFSSNKVFDHFAVPAYGYLPFSKLINIEKQILIVQSAIKAE